MERRDFLKKSVFVTLGAALAGGGIMHALAGGEQNDNNQQ